MEKNGRLLRRIAKNKLVLADEKRRIFDIQAVKCGRKMIDKCVDPRRKRSWRMRKSETLEKEIENNGKKK